MLSIRLYFKEYKNGSSKNKKKLRTRIIYGDWNVI